MTTTPGSQSEKNLILGVGSQRAGSTLHYKILNKSVNGLFMHPVKELHVFDSIHKIRPPNALKIFSAKQLERLEATHGNLNEFMKSFPERKRLNCEIRTNSILSNSDIKSVNYIDLFRPCLLNHNWIGEITPEYMLLSEEQLHSIKEVVNGKVLIVMMIRNPAKRFLSAFKLRHFYMRPLNQAIPDNESLLRDLNYILDHVTNDGWAKAQLRFNDYISAKQRLNSVFGENVLTLSLDSLIHQPNQTCKLLSDHLQLEVNELEAEKCIKQKVNETDIQLTLDQPSKSRIDDFFKESLKTAEELCSTRLQV